MIPETELNEMKRLAIADDLKYYALNPDRKTIPKDIVEQIAEKYNVSTGYVLGTKNKILKNLDQNIVEYTKTKFLSNFKKIEELAEDLIESSESNEDARRNIDIILKIIKEKTDYLERFHMKEKAKENINISIEKQLVIEGFSNNPIDAESEEVKED
jgi:hypothetical protein